MSGDGSATGRRSGSARDPDVDARLTSLVAENSRLRADHDAQVRGSRLRRAALVIGALGVVFGLVGVAFPELRTVAISLAGVGLFTSVLLYYTTSERFVSLHVAERIHDPLAEGREALVGTFGVADRRVYVPISDDPPRARVLALPAGADVPPVTAVESVVVDAAAGGEPTDGLSFRPSGEELFATYAPRLDEDIDVQPDELGTELAEVVVEEFELAADIEVEAELDAGRLRVDVVDAAFGPATRFDHPIASFFGTGFAVVLREAVRVDAAGEAEGREGERLVYRLEGSLS